MATANFVPKIWAATIMRELHNNLVAKKICTAEYTGEIKKKGDTVYFNGLAKPTIGSYTGATIAYEALQDSRAALPVDQADYFAFKIGDIEKIQSEMDLKGSQAQEAAFGLQQAADSYIMGLYSQLTAGVTATITSANVLSSIGTLKQLLAEANVPENSMWMCIPPWLQIKLELAGIKFQINNGLESGKGGIKFSDELGFDLYVTNQVKNTGTVATPISQVMAGSYNAIAYADQMTETEEIRLIDTFDTAARGLHVYGGKIIKPKEIALGVFTLGAETTI